jgi:hypothetical protein
MSNYPEINALNETYTKHKVKIRFLTSDFLADNKDYRAAEFKLGETTFHFYVEDEYSDIRYNYPLLNLCLVLRELESYADSDDYLIWCKEHYFDPKNQDILAHFKNLETVYRGIEKKLGKIDSHITNWDFEMGSGASWELRKQGLT